MYSYYFLSALGPSLQPYLAWKHVLTKLQMLQFLVFILHAIQPLFIECNYPKVQFIKTRRDFIEIKYIQVYCWIILGHGGLYFLLFANFYRKAYRSGKKTPQITEKMD